MTTTTTEVATGMRYRGDLSGAEYAAMEDGYEQGLAQVEERVRQARQAIWDYCESQALLAEESIHPAAVGLARAYRDVQDKLAQAKGVGAPDPTPITGSAVQPGAVQRSG